MFHLNNSWPLLTKCALKFTSILRHIYVRRFNSIEGYPIRPLDTFECMNRPRCSLPTHTITASPSPRFFASVRSLLSPALYWFLNLDRKPIGMRGFFSSSSSLFSRALFRSRRTLAYEFSNHDRHRPLINARYFSGDPSQTSACLRPGEFDSIILPRLSHPQLHVLANQKSSSFLVDHLLGYLVFCVLNLLGFGWLLGGTTFAYRNSP